MQYASSVYPFDLPLGKRSVLEYWTAYYERPDTKILGFIFTKLFSVIPNSMSDERTGSCMTFLFSKLRSRTDVNTMVEQIQVKQWYEMVDEAAGKLRRPKKKPVLKFRHLATNEKPPHSSSSNEGPIPVALDDVAGDTWLNPASKGTGGAAAEDEAAPQTQHGHLTLIDFTATSLLDYLSDAPRDNSPGPGEVVLVESGEQPIRKAADVNWD
ncbi:hypothetical protein FRC08_006022 [Ceratobasidium sp. 394]|nr:hypothetical protein FRC08_006022 [Ceratobasidium sp. 394]